jgi:putative membrane protein
MKRLILPLLGAGLLALNACSTTDSSTTTGDAASAGTSTTATADAGAGAPATVDTTNTATTTASSDTSSAMAMQGGGTAKADPKGPTAPHADDKEFMMSAAHSDQNEIQLSKMALTKGVSADAKALANQMITDHTKSTANLKPIAAKAGVTLPTDMDAEHKALAPTMAKLTGKEFETKYLAQMVTDHQKTANTLAAHKTMTKNTALSGWITTTLPVVEQHLSMSQKDSNMKM